MFVSSLQKEMSMLVNSKLDNSLTLKFSSRNVSFNSLYFYTKPDRSISSLRIEEVGKNLKERSKKK